MNVKLATALSIAGVMLAAGSAAAVNTRVLDSGSDSSIGSADDFVVDTSTPTPVPTFTEEITIPPTAPASTNDDDVNEDLSNVNDDNDDNGGTQPSPRASSEDNGGKVNRDDRTEAGDDRDSTPKPSASSDDDDRSESGSGSDDEVDEPEDGGSHSGSDDD